MIRTLNKPASLAGRKSEKSDLTPQQRSRYYQQRPVGSSKGQPSRRFHGPAAPVASSAGRPGPEARRPLAEDFGRKKAPLVNFEEKLKAALKLLSG